MIQFFLSAVLILVICKWVEIIDICKVEEMTQLKDNTFSDDSNLGTIIEKYVISLEIFLKHKRTNQIILIVFLVSSFMLLIDDQLKYWFRFDVPDPNTMSGIVVVRIIMRVSRFIVIVWIAVVFFNT